MALSGLTRPDRPDRGGRKDAGQILEKKPDSWSRRPERGAVRALLHLKMACLINLAEPPDFPGDSVSCRDGSMKEACPSRAQWLAPLGGDGPLCKLRARAKGRSLFRYMTARLRQWDIHSGTGLTQS